MRSENEILLEIKEKEKTLNLYSFRILGVSVWRIIRFPIRVNKLNSETGFTNSTLKPKILFKEVLFNYAKSFFQFLHIAFVRKKYKYLVLAFPRLSKHNEEYFDRFTDPLIIQSNLKNNSLVLQRNLNTKQLKPRFNKVADYKISDFLDYTSKLIGVLITPLLYVIFYRKIKTLHKNASSYFSLSKKFKSIVAFKIAEFLVQCLFAKIILNVTEIKQIFVVNRIIFLPFITMAKKRNVEILELQHGITHSETILYTGPYQQEIDPDIFLTFGSKWIGEQFSIPIKQQINIGWAYNSWLLKNIEIKTIPQSVLVVSSPEITQEILKVTLELAKEFKQYDFSIRLHPQERLTSLQREQIKGWKNIIIDDKKVDSLIAILKYKYIIGKNSSVLYEALSLGKPVGKIMFNGLHSKKELDDKFTDLFYLNSVGDFSKLLLNKNKQSVNSLGIYDIFDLEKFNSLLK